jgi:hypothetical protein
MSNEVKVAEPPRKEIILPLIVKQYMEKGYNQNEAIEAWKQHLKYQAKLIDLQTKENNNFK